MHNLGETGEKYSSETSYTVPGSSLSSSLCSVSVSSASASLSSASLSSASLSSRYSFGGRLV